MHSQPEANARHRINNQLINLGWLLEDNNAHERNVLLEGECKTEEQKKSLGRERPDYILYQKDTLKPIAVIEAKKSGKKLDQAIDQGIKYARRLRVNVIFASDGYLVKCCDINKKPLILDGVTIDDFVNENLLLKFTEDSEIQTNIPLNRNKLISIFKNAERLLRSNGIDADVDRVYQFCILLFIKINSERKGDSKWQDLCDKKENDILECYHSIIDEYKKNYKEIFREIKITKSNVLLKIVNSLSNIDLINTNIDVKGEAYEYFLSRYSKEKKSELGQHFTPRHITDMMTILLDPRIGDKIYDPFCGTGGMLISCYKFLEKSISQTSDIEILKKSTLFGSDINNSTAQLAKMNMIMMDDGNSNIKVADSIENPINKKYDKVITNIPFNLLPNSKAGKNYKVSFSNMNTLCVIHCLDSVRNGGSACIIVPENMCYSSDYIEEREHILKMGKLQAAIRLPRETFKSYTTARTCILFFTNIGESETDAFHYVNIEHDGFSNSVWREPINKNDIPDFLENRYDLEGYELIEMDSDSTIIPAPKQYEYRGKDYVLLGDIGEVKKSSFTLEANEEYTEPKLCSHTNTVRAKGDPRLGRNFKNREKVLIEPGDLVIGTLHTQSGNGLFAISEGTFVAESQLVLKMDWKKIEKRYLVSVLQHVLPKLISDDLVGRETFNKTSLLKIKIPNQPEYFSSSEYKDQNRTYEDLKKDMEQKSAKKVEEIFEGSY